MGTFLPKRRSFKRVFSEAIFQNKGKFSPVDTFDQIPNMSTGLWLHFVLKQHFDEHQANKEDYQKYTTENLGIYVRSLLTQYDSFLGSFT